MEISRMEMNKRHASFEVGYGRWRVQEQFGDRWVLMDDWYDEEVTSSSSYEDAFEAIAKHEEDAQKMKEEERLTGRKTFERVAKLIGAEVNKTGATSVDINKEYRILVHHVKYDYYGETRSNVNMVLVRMKDRMGKGTSKDREEIDRTVLDDGASDRTILNRYNKLIEEARNNE